MLNNFHLHISHSSIAVLLHSLSLLHQTLGLSFSLCLDSSSFCFALGLCGSGSRTTFSLNSLSQLLLSFCFSSCQSQVSGSLLFSLDTSSVSLALTLKQLSFCSLLGCIQLGISLLLFSVLLSFSSLLNFSFQHALLNGDLALLQLNFLLLASQVSVRSCDFVRLTLVLSLNLLSSISLSLLGFNALLHFCLLDSELSLLTSNLSCGIHLCIVSSLVVFSLSNGDFTLCIRLSDCSALTDLLNVVNTQVVDYAAFIREVLNIEGNQFQTELSQVRNDVCLNLIRESLTVRNHFSQLHLTNDFTHITFQQVINLITNGLTINVQEVLSCQCNHFGGATNANCNSRVNANIDILGSRNCGLGLYVDLNRAKRQLIKTFEERNLHTSLTDQNTRLLTDTGNDVGHIRGSLSIARGKQDDNCQSNQSGDNVTNHSQFSFNI